MLRPPFTERSQLYRRSLWELHKSHNRGPCQDADVGKCDCQLGKDWRTYHDLIRWEEYECQVAAWVHENLNLPLVERMSEGCSDA